MSIKEKITEGIQLPKEVVLNYPKLIMIGKNDITIENISGVVEFSDSIIRLNTETHLLSISGKALEITSLSLDEVIIHGDILNIIME